MYRKLLNVNSDELLYTLFEVTYYLSEVITAPFLTFGLPTAREDLAPLGPEPQPYIIFEILRR